MEKVFQETAYLLKSFHVSHYELDLSGKSFQKTMTFNHEYLVLTHEAIYKYKSPLISTQSFQHKVLHNRQIGQRKFRVGKSFSSRVLAWHIEVWNSITNITNKRKKCPQHYKAQLVTFFPVEILIYEKYDVSKTFTASASYWRLNVSFLLSFLYMDHHCNDHLILPSCPENIKTL